MKTFEVSRPDVVTDEERDTDEEVLSYQNLTVREKVAMCSSHLEMRT